MSLHLDLLSQELHFQLQLFPDEIEYYVLLAESETKSKSSQSITSNNYYNCIYVLDNFQILMPS